MSAKEAWSPYGLEAIRIRYLRRRRLLSVLFALGLMGMWLFMFETTTRSSTDIFVNGERAGNGIEITEPEQREDGPVSVSIEPGRVVRAESGGGEQLAPTARATAPTFTRDAPIPYDSYVIIYGPFLLLALAAYLLAKKRGKHDQVNYGVYKGALPLELVSASMQKQIFTTRWAKTSLFGKRRADHLPEEILAVERVPQEEG